MSRSKDLPAGWPNGRIAYTAILLEGTAKGPRGEEYGLGVVVENEQGYHVYQGAYFTSWKHAMDTSDELNAKMGLSKLESTKIVLSSMRFTSRR